MSVQRIVLQANELPFAARVREVGWATLGIWPARWIQAPAGAMHWAARLRLSLSQPLRVRLHVSADERYRLFIDGERAGDGPERGTPQAWHYESYDLDLGIGEHLLLAHVWSLGGRAPLAQESIAPGFLCAAEGEHLALVGTGHAGWEVHALPGTELLPDVLFFDNYTGARQRLVGEAIDWAARAGVGSGWTPAVPGPAAEVANAPAWPSRRVLVPAELPAQRLDPISGLRLRHVGAGLPPTYPPVPQRVDAAVHCASEAPAWQAWLDGREDLVLAPGTLRRAIIDLGDYHCYEVALTAAGAGAEVRILAAEALMAGNGHTTRPTKAHRDQVDGLEFVGSGPCFSLTSLPRTYSPGWWTAGRYLELTVQAGSEPCRLERLALTSTRYPLERHDRIDSDEPRLAPAMAVMLRALQMCAHETWMDCPYYEQLAYISDTRFDCLVTYVIGGDDRICRAALGHFARERFPNGLIGARAPCREPQVIPPFCLYWIGMLHDLAWWRDPAVARAWLPTARGIADAFLAQVDDQGRLAPLDGWNYVDWVPGWPMGMLPGAPSRTPAVVHWHLAWTLMQLAELEDAVGEAEPAARWRRHARRIAARVDADTWDDVAGIWVEAGDIRYDLTQAMAILSGLADPGRMRRAGRALASRSLLPATISSSFYTLEALGRLGHGAAIAGHLEWRWYALVDRGLKTTPEMDEPNRSDCHAWGAHPLFHLHATLLGVRPAAPGFASVRIVPCPGAFGLLAGELPHPGGGRIVTRCQQQGDRLLVEITLPAEVPGVCVLDGIEHVLAPGSTTRLVGRASGDLCTGMMNG